MSPRRPSFAFAACSTLALLAGLVACGANAPTAALVNDPDPSGQGQAGEAGSSGQSGQAGQAGSSGQSGQAGQAGSSGQGPSGGAGGGAGEGACDGAKAEGVSVAPLDLYRYPSYAVDGCSLLYLAPVAGGAELRLRDLASGAEQTLASADEKPVRPTIAQGVAAWEATSAGRQVVRARAPGKDVVTIEGAFAQATEPSAAPDAVAFTAWKGASPSADTDVMLYLVATGEVKAVAASSGQQRFADASLGRVAFTDFGEEDPDGAFNDDGTDLADVAVLDRASWTITAHKKQGKQAFPLVGSEGHVVFLEWPGDHPEPKLQAYGVRAWAPGASAEDRVLGDVDHSDGAAVPRPTTRGGLVEWVMYPAGSGRLYRASLASDAAPTPVGGLEGKQLFAPASAGDFSVLAARPAGDASSPPLLVVLAH